MLISFAEAEKFFSVTLAQEKLSPSAEKERSLLADKFRKLKAQLGCENDLPGGGKAPPRPPKGGMAISAPAANDVQDGEDFYDDVAGNACRQSLLNFEILAHAMCRCCRGIWFLSHTIMVIFVRS